MLSYLCVTLWNYLYACSRPGSLQQSFAICLYKVLVSFLLKSCCLVGEPFSASICELLTNATSEWFSGCRQNMNMHRVKALFSSLNNKFKIICLSSKTQ